MKDTLCILMKGISQKIPVRTKSRSGFIRDRVKYEMMRSLVFDPVPGVSIAVEIGNRYPNFRLGEEDLSGLVVFFGGDIKCLVNLTESQIEDVIEWFTRGR